MSVYRDPIPPIGASLSYDYAAALDRQRSRVALNALRATVWLVCIFGLCPFVALFGGMGVPIGLAAYAFVGVPLALRRARISPTAEIEAYEEKLLRKKRR